jgi:pimeloyl-ACP methyl ester carboxylesterase
MRRRTVVLISGVVFLAALVATPSVAAGWIASHPEPVAEGNEALESFGAGWSVDESAPLPMWVAQGSAGQPTIVMVHGIAQPRSDLRELASHLNQRGYGIALIELPYLDGSEPYSGGGREARAIDVAVKHANQQSTSPVVLMGFSAGGFASALAVRDGTHVDALLTDSAFVSAPTTFRRVASDRTRLPKFAFAGLKAGFGVASNGGSLEDVRNKKFPIVPAYVIHCESDDFVLPDNATTLSRLTNGDLWMAPGDGHGGAWYNDPAEYEQRVDDFIQKATE